MLPDRPLPDRANGATWRANNSEGQLSGMCRSEEITSYGESTMKGPSLKLFTILAFASSLGLRTGLAQIQSGKVPPKEVSVMEC